jgi:SAM-dependent methyltransferase
MPQHNRSYQAKKSSSSTSWQQVSPWYNKLVGQDGHFYHESVVLPGVLRLLDLKSDSRLLDLGCGQGILAKKIPAIAQYLGWDSAPALIRAAQTSVRKPFCEFAVADVTKKVAGAKPVFSHAVIMLALQNMEHPAGALLTASQHLEPGGKLVIVLNHPCFRIPRQSGWGIDEKTKQQYRWQNRYKTEMKIPIEMHPGERNSTLTWSFHHSLHDYSEMLNAAGFVIAAIEEWTSTKESVGSAAKMENRARSEFPLFLTILAQKK